jgi:hypothetical protein
MKTTELFAELLVIGVGASCACLLVLLTLVPGLGHLISRLPAAAIIPSLAVIYLIGILADRISDFAFDALVSRRRRGSCADDLLAWKNRRDAIMMSSSFFASLYAYSRSRQRILRAWTLNSIGLALSSLAYLTTQDCSVCGTRTALVAVVGFLALGLLCFVVWNKMDKQEVAAILRAAEE